MAHKVLEGIRVLDMTLFQLGPVNTMMLALMGAEVIKIEPPIGEPGRINTVGRVIVGGEGKGAGGTDLSSYYEANNHCKKSLVLDLKKPRAKEILHELVAKSDVFAQNMRYGVAKRLGAGYEELKQCNPKLIYYNGSSFGTKGPDASKPGMDSSGIARSGWMYQAATMDGEPLASLTGSSDQIGAIIGCMTILGALLARERFGLGQECETSHTTASMWLMQCRMQMQLYQKKWLPTGNRTTVRNPTFNYYRCGDGLWLSLCCSVPRYWEPLCQALSIPPSLYKEDSRFNTASARANNSKATVALLDEYFGKYDRPEVMKRFEGKDICWEKVQKWEDLPTDPQVIANEYMSDYTHPLTGETYKQVNIPMKWSETGEIIQGRAPLLGEHTAEILTDILGYKKEEVPKIIEEIGPPTPMKPME
jgi:CoA:oxalate CoA-transferase